jgi:magnesium chelatase family protein
MSLAVLHSRAISGMDAPPVTVEAHLANGLPSFTIVGLPEAEVKEAKDRVRAALQTARFEFPARRITVNLAPADLPKESGCFTCPSRSVFWLRPQVPDERFAELEFAGELALTGELRPIRGALAMTYGAYHSGRAFVLPELNAPEAALVRDATVYPARTLLQVCAHLTGAEPLQRWSETTRTTAIAYPDMTDVMGQVQAKRALEVAAAGAHSLIVGAPGTGKTMLAERPLRILPLMTDGERRVSPPSSPWARAALRGKWGHRPFRAPHHTASGVALGAVQPAASREVSMAMHGVLFMDELPEFSRDVLEVLREP